MVEVPTLETPRLLLRAFRATDADAYHTIVSDEETMRYITGRPLSQGEAWRQLAMFVGHWELRGFGTWAVEEKSTGALLGRIGFHQPDGWPGFELGWTIARPHWGKGYAYEGAEAAMAHGFTALGRQHIISCIHADNHRSAKLAERLGEHFERDGKVLDFDVRIFGITLEQWQARRL